MSTAAVHPATGDDVAEIVRIQLSTWRTAYRDTLGAGVVAQLDERDLTEQWSSAIGHPDTAVHVATEGEFTVGFCASGPAPTADVAGPAGDLPADADRVGLVATVLVEPRWGRRGHGGRLLAAAATRLREHGAERGITWVAQSDSASLGFYRRAGWHPDGVVRTLDTGERTVRELRLTGSLDLHLDGPGAAEAS